MKKKTASAVVLLCLVTLDWRVAARQTPDWGSGVAPFALALIGDMPYGPAREAPFARLVAEINRDNDVDFVMHAGDIKAGSERCDNELILRRFGLYQTFQRAFVFTPGDNEWTDCHRVNDTFKPVRSSTPGRYCSPTATTTSSSSISRCPTCSFPECRPTGKAGFTGSRCTWTLSRAARLPHRAENRQV